MHHSNVHAVLRRACDEGEAGLQGVPLRGALLHKGQHAQHSGARLQPGQAVQVHHLLPLLQPQALCHLNQQPELHQAPFAAKHVGGLPGCLPFTSRVQQDLSCTADVPKTACGEHTS